MQRRRVRRSAAPVCVQCGGPHAAAHRRHHRHTLVPPSRHAVWFLHGTVLWLVSTACAQRTRDAKGCSTSTRLSTCVISRPFRRLLGLGNRCCSCLLLWRACGHVPAAGCTEARADRYGSPAVRRGRRALGRRQGPIGATATAVSRGWPTVPASTCRGDCHVTARNKDGWHSQSMARRQEDSTGAAGPHVPLHTCL